MNDDITALEAEVLSLKSERTALVEQVKALQAEVKKYKRLAQVRNDILEIFREGLGPRPTQQQPRRFL